MTDEQEEDTFFKSIFKTPYDKPEDVSKHPAHPHKSLVSEEDLSKVGNIYLDKHMVKNIHMICGEINNL